MRACGNGRRHLLIPTLPYRYGVWADWETPYVTLQPEYEAAQLSVFGKMFLNGHIYRGRKPVHWSPSSRTALAEAELEYPEGHKSRSIYVAMPLSKVGDKVGLKVLVCGINEVGDEVTPRAYLWKC